MKVRANGELGLSLIVTVTNIDEDEIMFKKRDRKKGVCGRNRHLQL